MPARIQLKRTKGWRMPPNTLKVDRSTRWGNPYVVGGNPRNIFAPIPNDAKDACLMYREAVELLLKAWPRALEPLRGKNLACWCKLGDPCHGGVLLDLANK